VKRIKNEDVTFEIVNGFESNAELNFGEFKSGELHGKHAVATWNLRIISAFA
jgi:hypothetical protein